MVQLTLPGEYLFLEGGAFTQMIESVESDSEIISLQEFLVPLATRTPLLKGCWFLGSKTQEQQNLCTGDTDNQNALLPCICQLINLHVPTPQTQSASHVRTQQEAPSWSHREKYWATDSKSVHETGKEDTGKQARGLGSVAGVRDQCLLPRWLVAVWRKPFPSRRNALGQYTVAHNSPAGVHSPWSHKREIPSSASI